jgi:hypothetical protein
MTKTSLMATVLLARALLGLGPSPCLSAATLKVTWQERMLIAAGGGYQGPWQMNASVYDYVDDPAVALDAQGAIGVVWADQARKDIFFQRFAPDGRPQLPAPVNVSHSPAIFSWLPKIVMTSGDPQAIYVLWQEIIFSGGSHGGDILFARSTDGGWTFRAPRNLSQDLAGSGKGRLTKDSWHNGSLALAHGPEGYLYAAWTDYEGTLWCSRSTDQGGTFAPPVIVAGRGGTEPARGPALTVGAHGTVYLAWTVGENAAAAIHVAQSRDHGRSFLEPIMAHHSGGHADAPKIAVDQVGTVHLVYAERPKGPLDHSHIVYLRLRQGEERFTPPVIIARPHAPRVASLSFPALAFGGQDQLFVLWEIFPGPAAGERFQGPAHRSQGLGWTASRDGGQTFAEPSLLPGSLDPDQSVNGSLQGLLMQKLAANSRGAIAVVNSTFTPGQRSRIWLIRGHAQED